MAQPSVEDVRIAWHKGLKRVWGLPARTHSALVAPICGLLHLRTELACRSAHFIANCLNSCNTAVRFVARHGIYFQSMRSPVGRNAQHCSSVSGVSLGLLAKVNKKVAWSVHKYDFAVDVIFQLLLVKHRCAHFANV